MYIAIKPIENNKILVEPEYGIFAKVINILQNQLKYKITSPPDSNAYTITSGNVFSLDSQLSLSVGRIELASQDNVNSKIIATELFSFFEGCYLSNSGDTFLISDNQNDYPIF